MFDGFTTIDYLLSYPGMIAACVILTQFSKRMLDGIKPNKTRYVVLLFAVMFCSLGAVIQGDASTSLMLTQTILLWFMNAVIVWFASMKAFETIAEPDTQTISIDVVNPEGDKNKYIEALNLGADLLKNSKVVKLKHMTQQKVPN